MRPALALLLTACASTSGPLPRSVPPDHDGPFTTYWAADKPREEGEYKAGQRHGHVAAFHIDGTLAFEGDFADGVPVGELVHRSRQSQELVRDTVADGKLEGPRTEHWPSGVEKRRVDYRAGRKHGVERQWHADGTLAREGEWTDDQPSGTWRRWDEAGRLVEERCIFVRDGACIGFLESRFDPEGCTQMQTRWALVDGQPRTTVTLWHRNGRQASLTEFVDDLEQGRDQAWDEQGVLRMDGRRARGARVGSWRFYDEGGRLVRQVEYRDGVEVAVGG